MAKSKAYVLYYPVGNQYKTALHELASMTTMKSVQGRLKSPTVRYVMDTGPLGNFRRESCELNEQSNLEVESHYMGKDNNL